MMISSQGYISHHLHNPQSGTKHWSPDFYFYIFLFFSELFENIEVILSYKKISSFFSKIAVNLKSLVCLDLNHVIEKTRESMSEILHVFKKCQRSHVPSTWVFFFYLHLLGSFQNC